uniref:Pentapeptide repeat-containing protein n=1 Tax=Chrysotila carterae TaxID=13221 RepID=A0A7S4ER97_CHRCT
MRSIFDETTSFEGVDFSEADLSYAELQGANLEGVRVKNSQFNYANLARSSFRHARLETVDFSHARAHFSDFSHASLKGCFLAGSFVESVFYDADLLATTFISGGAVAALQRADFTGAKNVAPDAFDGIPPDLLRDVAGIPPPPPP